MKPKTITYVLGSNILRITFDQSGDITSLKMNGVDKSQDGAAIDSALALIFDAGFNVQLDMSVANDSESGSLYLRKDECSLAKLHAEDRMMEGA